MLLGLLWLLVLSVQFNFSFTDMDGAQPVLFYYINPGHALERHAGKSKFRNKFYYQCEREDSWTSPGVRAFGRVNGVLVFQGVQAITPLCHVLYADKAGATKQYFRSSRTQASAGRGTQVFSSQPGRPGELYRQLRAHRTLR